MPFRTQTSSYRPSSPAGGGENRSTLSTIFDYLDRPGQAVRGAIKGGYDDNESVLGGAWKGLSGQKKVYGTDLLNDAGMTTPGWGRSGLGFAMDIATDPLTFLPAGAIGKVAKATGATALGKAAGRVVAGTGKLALRAAGAVAPVRTAQAVSAAKIAKEGLAKTFIPGYGLDPEFRNMKRLFDSSMRNNAEEVAQKVVEISKGYDPAVRRGALIWMEKGGNTLPEVAELGTKYKALMSDIFQREAGVGIQDAGKEIADYAPRVFGKKLKEGSLFEGYGRTVSAKNPFANKRQLATIDEALKAGAESDAALAVNARLRVGEKSIRSGQFLQDTAKKFGVKVERNVGADGGELGLKKAPEGYRAVFSTKDNPLADQRFFNQVVTLADGSTAKLRDIAMPEKIADDLFKSFLKQAKPKGTGMQLASDALDAVNKTFRAGATYLRPGFHMTNLQGNLWNMNLAGMNPAKGIMGTAKQAGGLWKGASEIPEKVGVYTRDEILGAIKKFNVSSPQSTFAGMDDVIGMPEKILEKLDGAQKRGLLKRYSDQMRKLGASIEGGSKEALFLNELKQGKTLEEAAGVVNKFLFDYSDLTHAEKTIRKAVPFYTWSRKNVPLQAEMLAKKPMIYAGVGKWKHAIESVNPKGNVAEQDRPEYLREDEAIQLPWAKKGGATYLDPYLPYKDLNMLGTNPLSLARNELISMLGPAFKVPLEVATNRNFLTSEDLYNKEQGYTGTVKRTPWALGLPMPVALQHLLSSVSPAIPALGKTITGLGTAVTGDPAGGASALASTLFGIRPTVKDAAAVKHDKTYNRATIKTKASRAKKQSKDVSKYYSSVSDRAKRLAASFED